MKLNVSSQCAFLKITVERESRILFSKMRLKTKMNRMQREKSMISTKNVAVEE